MMRNVLTILLLTLTTASQAVGQKADDWNVVMRTVRAELKARVTVRGTQLRLADIADVSGVDEAVVADAKRLVLGRTPAPGRARLLARHSLRALVDKAAKKRFDVRLSGADSVQVLPDVITLSPDELGTLARRWLWNALGWRGEGANIRRANLPQALQVTAGRFSTRFEVTPVVRGAKLSGLVKLRVRALVDGAPSNAVDVNLIVRRPRNVLVLKRRIPEGRPVTADDVTVEERIGDGTTKETLESADDLIGLIARRTLSTGTVLSRNDLKGRPIVFRGDAVTVRVVSGGLAITGSGTAMQSGGRGESIPVRTGDRRRIVHGRIIDSETVEVDMAANSRGND